MGSDEMVGNQGARLAVNTRVSKINRVSFGSDTRYTAALLTAAGSDHETCV